MILKPSGRRERDRVRGDKCNQLVMYVDNASLLSVLLPVSV